MTDEWNEKERTEKDDEKKDKSPNEDLRMTMFDLKVAGIVAKKVTRKMLVLIENQKTDFPRF